MKQMKVTLLCHEMNCGDTIGLSVFSSPLLSASSFNKYHATSSSFVVTSTYSLSAFSSISTYNNKRQCNHVRTGHIYNKQINNFKDIHGFTVFTVFYGVYGIFKKD
jgi:hypothetical protein